MGFNLIPKVILVVKSVKTVLKQGSRKASRVKTVIPDVLAVKGLPSNLDPDLTLGHREFNILKDLRM